MKLVPVESGICETGIRRTAKHAEFRCHKRPGLPCQPSSPKSPPLSRRCEEERGRSERRKGWFIRGRNLGVRSQRRGTKLEEDSDWTEEAERNFNCGPIAGASEAQLMPKRKTEDKAVQGVRKRTSKLEKGRDEDETCLVVKKN